MEIRKADGSERALVLGGGGATGNAWLIGIIAGLSDAGLAITEAELIIGTSAGSTAAAQITGAAPAELFAAILAAAPQAVANRPMSNHMEITGAIIAAAKSAADMRRHMGAWALDKDATLHSDAQTHWRTTVAARLPNPRWPQKPMLITAVDAHTGEPVVFDRNHGVDLVDAVAASTAGGFAYTIGERRYIDGGYRADVNADLAAGYDRVLVIAPLGEKTRKQLAWGLHLTAQVDDLRTGGAKVETIFPDSESEKAMGAGMNLMDLSTRRLAAQGGYNQGKALAIQLTEFWN